MNEGKFAVVAAKSGEEIEETDRPGRPTVYSGTTQEQFLQILEECGKIRVACAAVGWSEALVHSWRQSTHRNGAANDHYRPDFDLSVELALSNFQRVRISNIISAGSAKDKHDWKADVWLLERLFGSDYAAAKASDAGQDAGRADMVEVTVSEEELADLQERRRKSVEAGLK